MISLFKRALKDRGISTLIFAISLFLYSWMLMTFIPTFLSSELIPQFEALFKSYPKEIISIFAGGDLSISQMMMPEGFIAINFLALWWIVIVGSYAIAFGTAVVGKEIDDGTIEILLVQPISRTKIILGRFLACLFSLFLLSVITIGSIGVLGRFYDVEFKIKGLISVGFLGLLFFIFIAAFSLLLSIIFKERGRSVSLSVAFLLGSHLLNALSDLSDILKNLRFLSIFKYYNPFEALKTGNVSLGDVSVFLVLILLSLAASLIIFKRKDVSIT